MTTIQQQIEAVLRKDVKDISTDIIGSVVVDMNGFTLGSNLSTEQDADLIAGVVSTFIGSVEILSDQLLREPFEQIHIKSAGKYIILNSISENMILAVMTTDKVKVGLIIYWLRERIIPQLKSILKLK